MGGKFFIEEFDVSNNEETFILTFWKRFFFLIAHVLFIFFTDPSFGRNFFYFKNVNVSMHSQDLEISTILTIFRRDLPITPFYFRRKGLRRYTPIHLKIFPVWEIWTRGITADINLSKLVKSLNISKGNKPGWREAKPTPNIKEILTSNFKRTSKDSIRLG